MTAPAIHLWRLLKWGRILARHGALRGIERDPNTPTPVRRLARIARIGARVPAVPRYADALQAIGPAAIKLGQTLATRPDIVGEAASDDLMRFAGCAAAGPVRDDPRGDDARVRARSGRSVRLDRPGAGRRRLDRASPPCDHHRRAHRRGESASPRRRGGFRARDRHLSMGGGASRGDGRRTRPVASAARDRDVQALDRARIGFTARGGVRIRTRRCDGGRARFHRAENRLATHQRQGADAGMDRRDQAVEPPGADRRRLRHAETGRYLGPCLPAPGDRRGVLSRRHASGKHVRAARQQDRRDRLRHHGADRPARGGCGWPRFSTG